jgi:hypothetical protein
MEHEAVTKIFDPSLVHRTVSCSFIKEQPPLSFLFMRNGVALRMSAKFHQLPE